MDSDHDAILLTLPGRAEYVRLGRLALAGIGHARPLSAESLGDLKLALTEACALRQAPADEPRRYEIRYELHDDRLVIELTDDGDGFVIEEGAPVSEAALGLDIIRALADEVELGRRGDGAGSCLRFVMHLDD